MKCVFSRLLFCLPVELEDRLHLYRRSRASYIWLYYLSVRSGLFASSKGGFPCRKPSAERIQIVWIAAPPMHLYYLKKKKSTTSLEVGGGEGREENTLVCSSSRLRSLWLHIDVFQMLSCTRSSGHGWKTNSYFSVSVRGPGDAGSLSRSPSFFVLHTFSLLPSRNC